LLTAAITWTEQERVPEAFYLFPCKISMLSLSAITLPKIHTNRSFKGENIKSITGTMLGLVRPETA